jgi:NTP pyrophosphatase (non-canonical NTP hydrolase)
MNVREWEQWLVEDQWAGYKLHEIMCDAHLPVPSINEPIDLLNAYQALRSLFILCTGFNGEGGEVTEHFKKYIRDGKFDREKVALELGDRLAYLVWLAHAAGLTLDEIAEMNQQKLLARGRIA